MKIFNNRTALLLTTAILCACSDTGTDNAEVRAVVEAYLRPGEPIEVTVSKEGLFEDATLDSLEYIDGLALTVKEGDDEYALESVGDGRYVSEESVTVEAGKVYSLDFDYNSRSLSSSTYVPSQPVGFALSATEIEIERFDTSNPSGTPPTMADPIETSWDNPDNDYHMVVVTVIEEDPEEINEEGGLDFSGTFRNEPGTGTSYSLQQSSFEYYGMHAVVLYKLNAEYAALYEDSGSSSLNLKSPYSNITNGLGIFTGVNADTLYINVKKPD